MFGCVNFEAPRKFPHFPSYFRNHVPKQRRERAAKERQKREAGHCSKILLGQGPVNNGRGDKRELRGRAALKLEKRFTHGPAIRACTVHKWFRYLTGAKSHRLQLRSKSRLIEGAYERTGGSGLQSPVGTTTNFLIKGILVAAIGILRETGRVYRRSAVYRASPRLHVRRPLFCQQFYGEHQFLVIVHGNYWVLTGFLVFGS